MIAHEPTKRLIKPITKSINFDDQYIIINDLLNGNLEAGSGNTFTGWEKAGTILETSDSYTGTRAAQYNVNSSNAIVDLKRDNILTVGHKYRLEFYAKIDVPGSGRGLQSSSGLGTQKIGDDLSDEYEYRIFEFVASQHRINIFRHGNCHNRLIYVDQLTLTRIG